MKKSSLILLLVALYLELPAQVTTQIFMDGEIERAQAMASNEGKLSLLYFSADWCMPCQWMEERTFSDTALQAFMTQNVRAVKVDIDAPLGRSYQKLYRAKALPTILIYNSQGELLQTCTEALSAEKLLAILASYDMPVNRWIVAAAVPSPSIAAAFPEETAQVITPTTLPLGTGELKLPEIAYQSLPEIAKPVVNASREYGSLPEEEPTMHAPIIPDLVPESKPVSPAGPAYVVQLGAFGQYDNAQRLRERLDPLITEDLQILTAEQNNGALYKVVAGTFAGRSQAFDLLQNLKRKSIKGFVLKID